MSRELMRLRCPAAIPLGVARLDGWRFTITTDGYASIAPKLGAVVHGVLWRISPRDRAVLDAYEDLSSGLYHRRTLPVQYKTGVVSALVYVGRQRRDGQPRPGYLEIVVAAARDWSLQPRYVMELSRMLPSGLSAIPARETGEIPGS
jgi:gamma-glutamylcyclotransferase (GGCT)/AIG2-like uncharacterized protein YtfP